MNKDFDCVQMKHRIQEELYEEINPKNIDEYFDKLISSARKSELWKHLQAKSLNNR